MIKDLNNKKKLLFISNKLDQSPIGGRKNLTSLNEKILKKNFGKGFFSFKLEKKKISSLKAILMALSGNIDGITNKKIESINNLIEKNNIKYVFLDGSNLGKIARKLKNKDIKTITFCHNVETNFFLKKFKTYFNLKNLYILISNYFAEFQSVYFSNYLIFLNKRDKIMMSKYFFKKKSFIIPMCLDDKFKKFKNSINKNKYIIFVGSNFFGNTTGLEWYIRNIANNINLTTYVIGKDLRKKNLKNSSKVKFKGYVKNLNKYYKNALFTVAPIFKGSGMKTKVAEAFMFGKKILATRSALTGYDNLPEFSYYLCNTSKEYIDTIESLVDCNYSNFDENIRNIYEKKFSLSSSQTILRSILVGK